jgi:hypothetical protein
MAAHWVKALKTVIRHDLTGAYRTYQPGDWFQAHNQEMLDLLARGLVETNTLTLKQNFAGCDLGVVARGGTPTAGMFAGYGLGTIESDAFDLPWERTALWDVRLPMTAEAIALGLIRVDGREEAPAWEMAAMLAGHTQLARDIGSDEEQARTLAVLGDLRLPVYETGILWVRRTEATEEVIQLWRAEVEAGAEERHAFLRTIYTRRLLLNTLPADWIGQWTRA